MKVTIINEQDAPTIPKASSKAARESLAVINRLEPGKVAKITPDEGQSIRGIKTSLTRVGSKNGRPVITWDDGSHVYAKLAVVSEAVASSPAAE
jgi:hypothetical protein